MQTADDVQTARDCIQHHRPIRERQLSGLWCHSANQPVQDTRFARNRGLEALWDGNDVVDAAQHLSSVLPAERAVEHPENAADLRKADKVIRSLAVDLSKVFFAIDNRRRHRCGKSFAGVGWMRDRRTWWG